jgi:tetratricopeptide (TPR) repeat protein
MSNRAAGIQQIAPADESVRVEFESVAKAFYEQNQYRRVITRTLSEFCLAFRRELLDKIGYFDDQFVLEEIAVEDFCNRAASKGYQNLIAADTYVHHYDRHPVKKKASKKNSASVEDQKRYKEKWNNNQNPEAQAFQTVQLLAKVVELSQIGQTDTAVKTVLGTIGLQPENQRLYLALAEILLTANRFQDAKDALTEMPPADDDKEMRKAELLGYAEEGLENFEAAQNHIEQVLAMNPDRAQALNLKGILAYRNDDCRSAEKYFKRAIDADPGYGEPYTNLGMLQLGAENHREALKSLEKGFRLTPTDIDIATNYHALIAGIAEYEKAENVARDAAYLYPCNQKLKYMLIDFLVHQGKYDRAMSEIEAAIVKFGIDDGILAAALKIREILGPNQISEPQRRTAVSLCMIVKDEEQYLAHCLASVKPIVEEMIVVDTGSTDSTKDIAVSFGAKVYDYDWNHNFAEARNFSISKASGSWILIMDADEVISYLDYPKFEEIVKVPPKSPAAFSIITRNYCTLANTIGWVANDGKYSQEEAGIGWIPSVKVRLFYGKDLIWFEGVVHELLDPVLKRKGIKIKHCGIPIHHYGRLDKGNLDRKGEIYFEIGKKKLEEMGDDLTALRELAVQATIIGKNEEAIELWERLLALKPDSKLSAEVFINMGTVYSRMGKYQDALCASKKAIAHSPELKEAIYNYSMAELHLGNAGKTIEVLEEMLTKVSDYPPAQFILVAAYSCHGNKERSLEELKKLKSTKMGSAFVYSCVELAKGLITADQIDYAISLLGAAIDSEIVNADLLNLFKECLNIKKKTETFDDINTQLPIFSNQKNKLKHAAVDVSPTY